MFSWESMKVGLQGNLCIRSDNNYRKVCTHVGPLEHLTWKPRSFSLGPVRLHSWGHHLCAVYWAPDMSKEGDEILLWDCHLSMSAGWRSCQSKLHLKFSYSALSWTMIGEYSVMHRIYKFQLWGCVISLVVFIASLTGQVFGEQILSWCVLMSHLFNQLWRALCAGKLPSASLYPPLLPITFSTH